jgi:hypothetical protein
MSVADFVVSGLVVGLGAYEIVARVLSRRSRSRKTPAIARWHASMFQSALTDAERFISLLTNLPTQNLATSTSEHTPVDADTLAGWALDSLLTAAARISSRCQGKANLFVVDVTPTETVLVSKYFVGSFPIDQLTATNSLNPNAPFHRRFPVTTNSEFPVAAKALARNGILMVDLRKDHQSDVELRVGTTHILAIPITEFTVINTGQLAVIAIDFRMNRIGLIWHWRPLPWKALDDRARALQEAFKELVLKCPGI